MSVNGKCGELPKLKTISPQIDADQREIRKEIWPRINANEHERIQRKGFYLSG
jgi:hypothetical protein